jgi:hypothetical protein
VVDGRRVAADEHDVQVVYQVDFVLRIDEKRVVVRRLSIEHLEHRVRRVLTLRLRRRVVNDEDREIAVADVPG